MREIEATIVPQDRKGQQETVVFALGPREGMEYKYRLEKGEALLYSWSATVPLADGIAEAVARRLRTKSAG